MHVFVWMEPNKQSSSLTEMERKKRKKVKKNDDYCDKIAQAVTCLYVLNATVSAFVCIHTYAYSAYTLDWTMLTVERLFFDIESGGTTKQSSVKYHEMRREKKEIEIKSEPFSNQNNVW